MTIGLANFYNNCWDWVVDGCGVDKYYEGLGGPYDFDCGWTEGTHLLYYQKGGEVWGTPHNFDYLTSIEQQTKSNFNVKIAPNPMYEQAIITVDNKFNQNFNITIFNALGKRIKTISSNGDNQIVVERNGLSSGVYFYQIQSQGVILDNGKLLIR